MDLAPAGRDLEGASLSRRRDRPEGLLVGQGYDWRSPLTVTGRRIDGSAPPLGASNATNAFADDIGSSILVGVEIPAAGCWEITGHLKGITLSFVVWVPA